MEKKDTLLIVDDMEMNREMLVNALRDTYHILVAEDGEDALRVMTANLKNISLILMDIKMPKMDAFQVMEVLKKKNAMKYIPIILITGESSEIYRQRAYELGAVELLTKPYDMTVVRFCVRNVIELYREKNNLEAITISQNRQLKAQAERLKKVNSNILEIMGSIIEFRGLENSKHLKRLKKMSRILAECVSLYYKEYGLTEIDVDLIEAASSMHDIGKIVIPDSILLKPGKLTPDEFEVMKSHASKGSEIMELISEFQDEKYYRCGFDICRFHHERYDGNGYPQRLKGDAIPISAQIVSIAEAFDALISNRVYKAGAIPEKAYTMIMEGECGVFSPKIIECFRMCKDKIFAVVDEFPEDE